MKPPKHSVHKSRVKFSIQRWRRINVNFKEGRENGVVGKKSARN